jgi:hypothetical protein
VQAPTNDHISQPAQTGCEFLSTRFTIAAAAPPTDHFAVSRFASCSVSSETGLEGKRGSGDSGKPYRTSSKSISIPAATKVSMRC